MLKSKVFFCGEWDTAGVRINREGRETRPQPRVRRAKLGAFILDARGQGARSMRPQRAMPSLAQAALGTSCAVVLVAWPAGNVLFPALLKKEDQSRV